MKRIGQKNLEYERETREWLQRVVVGMSLCPFAERPLKENKLKIVVVRGDDIDIILTLLHGEMAQRVELPGTTLGKPMIVSCDG